ncbi:dermonecrotic toxin domain-containing protein [Pseudomonas fluorescens]|uniref:dermonecrotic toxin domain-containing protein n=1 Tax=Pseudomonas fluorescens TaxID=294 RepID=UPI0037481A05
MLDPLTLNLPPSPSESFAKTLALPPTIDDSLLSQANQRWRDSSNGLRELFASSPALRDTINASLRQQLQLDGEKTGFGFTASQTQAEHFVSLTDACAFVVQHPAADFSLDQRCHVIGLMSGHPLYTLRPSQLLEKLKRLDPQNAHATRWAEFWEARAPGTPVSRRTRAIALYRAHFEASADAAYASKIINAEELDLLQQIVDSDSTPLMFKDQPVHLEKPALVLSNHSKVKLPGAWVIRAGDPVTARTLLYLPCRPLCTQAFDNRADMQTWLAGQVQIPTGLPRTIQRFDYSAATDPMIIGASDLFADRQQAQISALRNTNRGKPGLSEHGAQALLHVDLIDHQRSTTNIVAAPAKASIAPDTLASDDRPLFGSLSAGIPLALRHAALKREREALEHLLANDRDGARFRQCQAALSALETAEQACETACTSWLDDSPPSATTLAAIYQAHKNGLYAEAKLQSLLGQVDSAEHELLKAVLDHPVAGTRDADLVAASLTLSLSETLDATTTVQRETLKGALVFTRQAALTDSTSDTSLLLYCPGNSGGLQRFSDRRALALALLKVDDQDSESALQLDPITTDPLQHCLNTLIADCETQATRLRAKPEHADALAIFRQDCMAAIQVPVSAARGLMFAHVQEQERSGALATHLPGWLVRLQKSERIALKQHIQAYIEAMRKSHALMTLALEPRDDFTRKHLHARLRKDFAIEGYFSVQVELPDSTTTETVVESSPAGQRRNTVIVPGATRSRMSLEDLAQLNIDNVQSVLNDALSQRLIFMRLDVNAARRKDRSRLLNGINLSYLRKVLPELDLPKAYERRIHEAFHGAPDEALFVRQHRRESLIEPWRLLLKIQCDNARAQKHLAHDEAEVVNIAIDANTTAAWLARGKRIVLLPVALKTGGKDTPREGPVTLSGVTFIEEQISGTTVLYLPDSPDQRFFRRYDSLESARKGLFRLCASDHWIDYLAGKALHGDVRAHVSRIGQAVEKNFDAIIDIGPRWPASTSLAAHLLDAHKGRLIEAHRGSSRSNDELFFERFALKGPRAFNYIKMALGMVPFVGTVVALYDAWTAANQAVAAFLRGEVADGLAEIETMLLSLVDAFMDLLPGEALASTLSRTTRALTRSRQLHTLLGNVAALHGKTQRQARHVLARFQGYDYEQPLSLAGIEPATHGLYRGVYRHADGDFIERQGRIYQVELVTGSRNWRLFGNSRKTYKQPIALDETGRWDTWHGVYGSASADGLRGGGNVAGHLADALDPYWPPVIRQHLPRWWAERTFRRHQQLEFETERLANLIDSKVEAHKTAILAFQNASPANQRALLPAAETACLEDIRLSAQRYQALTELKPLTSGNKQAAVGRVQSSLALRLTSRYAMRSGQVSAGTVMVLEDIRRLNGIANALPPGARSRRSALLAQVRELQLDYVKKFEELESSRHQLNHWYERITSRSDKVGRVESVNLINRQHSDARLLFHKTYMRLELVKDYRYDNDVSWMYFRERTEEMWKQVRQAVTTQYDLPNLQTSAQNRSLMLEQCLDVYTRFRRQMTIWMTDYPEHFHLDVSEPLLDGLEQMASHARRGVIEPAVPKTPGQPAQRVFTTEDGDLLYGTERFDSRSQRRVYERQLRDGEVQIWEQGADGRSRQIGPQAPRPQAPQVSLAALVKDARQRLDRVPAYRASVLGNADRGMLPIDLQHMMDTQASELNIRADRIAGRSAQHPLIQQLRDQAAELSVAGRTLRTERSLTSQKPTDGMLDDLIGQGAVEIRRRQPIALLGMYDDHPDYMQEYEIWNITREPEQLLWYAHFHYRNATPVFESFETAHLKLPQHRLLTHADDATLPYSKISKQSVAIGHFERVRTQAPERATATSDSK